MKESYSESVAIRPQGVWVSHGDASGASALDGYQLRYFAALEAHGGIESSPDGTLWSWSGQQLSRFRNSRWEAFSVESIARQGRVRRDWDRFWVFTSNRSPHLTAGVWLVGLDADRCLILLPNQILEFETAGKTSSVVLESGSTGLGSFTSMRRGLTGDIVVTGHRGVGKLSGSKLSWSELVQPPGRYGAITEPFENEDGELFVTALGGGPGAIVLRLGALRLGASRWEPVYRGASTDLRAWSGVEKTVWIQDGNRLLHLTAAGKPLPVEPRGPLFGIVKSSRPEAGNRFWVGTTQGLARYAPPLWRSPPETLGIDDLVSAITEDKEGRIWFLSLHSLICFDGRSWEFFRLPPDRRGMAYTMDGLGVLPDETIAIRTFHPDLLTFDPRLRQFRLVSHPAGRVIGVFAPRPDGLLLMQTFPPAGSNPPPDSFAFETFDGREFRTVLKSGSAWGIGPGIGPAGIGPLRCFTTNNVDSEIWAGSNIGFGVYRRGAFVPAGSPAGFTDPGIFSLRRLRGGKLLAGGRDGLFAYDGKAWSKILSGLDRVRDITEGRDGSVWIACGTGIWRLREGMQINYGIEEGLASTVGYRVFEDSRGRIWAGTSGGISLLHPDADLDSPRTQIGAADNAHEVPPGGRVNLAFSGVDKWKFTGSERLLYSWRIDGGKWSPFTSQTTAQLDKLSRGGHRFEVRAMDRNGNIDPHPPGYSFSVLPAWYRTTGFKYFAGGFALTTGLLIGVALSEHRLLRRRKKLESDRQEITEMIARREPLGAILQRIVRAIAENHWGAIGGALNYKDEVRHYLAIPGPPVRIAYTGGQWSFEPQDTLHLSLVTGATTEIRSGAGELLGEMVAIFRLNGGRLNGRRVSGRRTQADVSVLRALGSAAAVAIENACLYDLLRNANDRLEARIGERTQELLAANKDLEAFSYSVSHDLRAPLRHLDGFAALLRENCYRQIDAQGKRYLDKISAAAQRMGQLIDDLLSFSRLLRADVSRTHVNLQTLQEEVRQELEPDCAGRKIVWIVGNLPVVFGDRPMLRQVFVNLLSNAVKYTRGRAEARIEIGCAGATAEEATVFVRDNGAGFEMQYADKLFGVFQRLHGAEFEGTGVGLANVHRIVTRHGGRVWAEGAVDRGATFYVSLRLDGGSFSFDAASGGSCVSSRDAVAISVEARNL